MTALPLAHERDFELLMTPVPMGERRSSGTSALHSIYRDDSHLLVDVTVSDVKEDCVLGLVLEQLDEDGAITSEEVVGTYAEPRAHQHIASVSGARMRIKWIQVGSRPSCTFGVLLRAVKSAPAPDERAHESGERVGIDLTTLKGLREYVGLMRREP